MDPSDLASLARRRLYLVLDLRLLQTHLKKLLL